MADSRTRNWSFVGYPGDSLPDDYSQILNNMRIAWAESPIHDADYNGDGSEKKRHIHFLLSFDGNKSFEQVEEITNILHCPIPQRCKSVKGLLRYFIHLDNPEKHQYSQDDIKYHCGFDPGDSFGLSDSALNKQLASVFSLIREQQFTEYCDLVDYLLGADYDLFVLVTRKFTLAVSQYIKSKKFKLKEIKEQSARDIFQNG